MRGSTWITRFVSAFVLSTLLAVPLAAAEPELISAKPFDVQVADGLVTVNFTLALSEVASYPVKITAICCTKEDVLYEGTLSEGAYRFSAPLKTISGHGDLTVVLQTRVTNRSSKTVEKDGKKVPQYSSDSFSVYLKWQGPM